MTGSHDRDGTGGLTFPGKVARILLPLTLLLFAASVAAIGWVPDIGIYRPKVVWGRALFLAASGCLLLTACLRGRLELIRGGAILACSAPMLVALGWVMVRRPESDILALDEILRLGLFPLAIATASLALRGATRRRFFLIALSVVALGVAAVSVAQNLAGVLQLPLERQARALASFGNPVFLGAFLVQVTPLVLAQALYGRAPDRWLGAVAGGLCLPALLATGTRSAWLGMGAGIVIMAVLLVRRATHRRLLIVGLILVAGLLTPFVLPHIERPQQHALIWHDTLDLVDDHPFGVGPGQYLLAFVPYASRELLAIYPRESKIVNDAHSEPLQLLAELGWIGLAAAAIALAVLIRVARRLLAERPGGHEERPLIAACFASLCGVAVQSLASPDLRFVVGVILTGLITGMMLSHATPRVTAGRAGGWIALVAALGCFWLGAATTRSALAVRPLLTAPLLAEAQASNGPPAPAWLRQEASRRKVLDILSARSAEDPADWSLLLSLALVQHADGRLDQAMTSLRRVLDLQPRHPAALAALGTIEVQAQHFQPAFEHLSLARDALPNDTDVRFWLARTALQLGNLSVAWQEVEALLSIDPTHSGGLVLREKLRE